MKLLLTVLASIYFVILTFSVSFSETRALVTNYYYKVNKNDTMWDISKRYYKNPSRWQALYSKNKKVYNPNLIFPGEYLLLKKTVIIKDITNENRKALNNSYIDVKRSEFVLKTKVAGSVMMNEDLALDGQILNLKPYKKLRDGEIITLIRKLPENIGAQIVKPVGYARVIKGNKAVVTKLFDEIGSRIYFVEGSRKPVLIDKKPIKIQKISLFGENYLSIFRGSTLWGRVSSKENIIGKIVVLSNNSGDKVISGVVTSQYDNIVGITVTGLYNEYEPGIYTVKKD